MAVAPAGFGGSTFNEILSSTFNKVSKTFVDNIFKARPLGYFLTRSDNVVLIDGGAAIVESIIGRENDTVASYSGWDQIVPAATEEITSATYPWRQLAATVSMAGIEEAQNGGEAQIMDLLRVKIDVAQESIVSTLNTMFHGDGTGNGGKDLMGLEGLLGSNAAPVGGIDPADAANTWWKSNIFDASLAATWGAGTTDPSLKKWSNAFNTASVGSDQPGFILTTQDIYEFYEGLLQPNLRYSSTAMADAGFQSLEFKGKPVLYDADTTAGYVWMINPKYLRLKAHRNRFFKAGPFIQPRDYDVRTMKMLTYGNLVVNNRSRHALITGMGTTGVAAV